MGRSSTIHELTAIIARNRRLGVPTLAPERRLAASLGVSRYEIKSAIAILKAKGMVEPRHGSGVYLKNPSATIATKAAKRKATTIAVGFLSKLNPGDIYYMKLFDALETAAAVDGVELSFHGDLRRQEEQSRLKELASANKIRGFLVAPGVPGRFILEMAGLVATVGIVNPNACGRSINCVEVNHHSQGLKAAEHLIKQGCRRLGFITDTPLSIGCQEQIAGMRAAAAFTGGVLDDGFVRSIPRVLASARRQNPHFWRQLAGVDGFLVRDDLMADLVVRRLAETGIRVPDDLLIVGVNNYLAGRVFKIPLTSIDTRLDTICAEAIGILQRQRSSRGGKVIHVLVEPELIIRMSTARAESPRL